MYITSGATTSEHVLVYSHISAHHHSIFSARERNYIWLQDGSNQTTGYLPSRKQAQYRLHQRQKTHSKFATTGTLG